MPLPNEMSCRLQPPEKYDRFARMERESKEYGKKYSVILGIKEEDGKETSEDQAYRYDVDIWKESEAREHCMKHNGTFEPAAKKTGTKILNILNEPWAIIPEKLQEIQSIYISHLHGEKINIKALEAKLGEPLQNNPKGYEVVNGNAIINIQGIIAKRMNLLQRISGGVSTEFVAQDFKTALSDPAINRIILYVDSPGGMIDGTSELAHEIYNARGEKPIIAYSDGMICSAAYWIASAADKIYISSGTVTVGGIGVVTSHIDMSAMEEKIGIKTTEIYAGKYKRIVSRHKPLTEEGKQTLQDHVDYLYTIFLEEVAKHRNISVAQVLKMAEGKLFIGEQAVEIGLVDGISTLDNLIYDKEVKMTVEELRKKYPDLVKAIADEAFALGKNAGREAEIHRIKSVREQLIPGHEALIEELMFDGTTTGEQAAVKVLAAERAILQEKARALMESAKNLPKVPVDVLDEGESIEQKRLKVIEEEKAKGMLDKEAILAASKKYPELFKTR